MQEKIHFNALKGTYTPYRDFATLKNNVKLFSKDFILKTSTLNIDFKDDIAFNNTSNKINSKNVMITGNNLLVNLKKETLTLTRVKTVVSD